MVYLPATAQVETNISLSEVAAKGEPDDREALAPGG
jgi:hypothetical protein